MNGLKDLEDMVIKLSYETGYCRAELVLEAVTNSIGFYEKCGFKKIGPITRKLQPMIKEIKPDATSKKTLQRTSRGAKTPKPAV